MCNLLNARDDKLVAVLLDGIANILGAADKMDELGKVSGAIEECEGLDKIELLQNHENESIYQKALNIIQTFFQDADDGIEVSEICLSLREERIVADLALVHGSYTQRQCDERKSMHTTLQYSMCEPPRVAAPHGVIFGDSHCTFLCLCFR